MSAPSARAGWFGRTLDRPGGLWMLVGAYLLLHALVRLLRGPAYSLDEAEQMAVTQVLQLGYGAQPPLYNWLQAAVFQATGAGPFGLVLLKYSLFAAFFACAHGVARELGLSARRAALATLSLLLIPEIFWTAQNDLTHTLLALALASAGTWLVLRLLRQPTLRDHALLGLVLGLGLMSKHLFWVWALGMLLAALWIAPRRVLQPRMLLTLLVALAAASPYLWWALGHLDYALAGTSKLRPGREDWLLGGLGKYLSALLVFVLPPLLVLRLTVGLRANTVLLPEVRVDAYRLLAWAMVASLLLYLLVLLSVGGSSFKARWLLPGLFALPALLFSRHGTGDSAGGERDLGRVLLTIALAAPLVLVARHWLLPEFGKVSRAHFPGPVLAESLRNWRASPKVVLASDHQVAGNLAHRLDGAVVMDPAHRLRVTVRVGDEVWLVWREVKGPDLPRSLAAFATARLGEAPTPAKPRRWHLQYRLSDARSIALYAAPLVLTERQALHLSSDPYAGADNDD